MVVVFSIIIYIIGSLLLSMLFGRAARLGEDKDNDKI